MRRNAICLKPKKFNFQSWQCNALTVLLTQQVCVTFVLERCDNPFAIKRIQTAFHEKKEKAFLDSLLPR